MHCSESSNPLIKKKVEIFHYCYSVVKTQPSVEFQNPIFHLFHFKNLYSTAIVEVLFLINDLLEKHFKEGYVFRVFLLWKCVFLQPSEFQM